MKGWIAGRYVDLPFDEYREIHNAWVASIPPERLAALHAAARDVHFPPLPEKYRKKEKKDKARIIRALRHRAGISNGQQKAPEA